MVKRIYKVAGDKMLLTIINKLGGMARDWFHSKPEHALLALEMLKSEMVKMYKSREGKITTTKKFEARRWKKSEKFVTYFHEKVLLENRIGLVEDDLINYIIDGIDNSILQTQAKMKEFKELSHMLQVLGDIANDEQRASTNRTAVVPPTTNASTRSRSVVRCFNCNQKGHISNRCPRPKRDRGSCFECGSMRHQKRNCLQRSGESTTTPDSTTLLVEEDAVIPPYTLSIHLSKSKQNFDAVLDTGSPVSLIREEIVQDFDLEPDCSHQSFRDDSSEQLCDASSAGYGAILMQTQDQDKKFHPAMFFSKRTTEAESKYHSYELECLAIVYAIKRFHIYLHQRKFKIITDCDSFRLALKKNIVPRTCRWALFLERL
ncbi:hypothetical protein Trydic_g12939 [Trypoxylus dichotomus]